MSVIPSLLRRKVKWLTAFVAVIIIICLIAAITIAYFLRDDSKSVSVQNKVATEVSLPNYYSIGMILQRDKPIVISGTATPKSSLVVQLTEESSGGRVNSNQSDSVSVMSGSDGKFKASLPERSGSSKNYTLTISSGNVVLLKIKKILIGDVFIAAGQSNMELNFKGYYEDDEVAAENMGSIIQRDELPNTISDRLVHFLILDHKSKTRVDGDAPLLQICENKWLSAKGDDILNLGYLSQFFAEQLRNQDPDIPVGIIQTAWDGTSITRHMQGGDIFTNHIAPFRGFNVAGILWYQGESDAFDDASAFAYQYRFATLINQYRKVFADDELPFLFVQLARYDNTPVDWAIVRQAQLAVALDKVDDNVAMVVSIDTDKGTSKVIHPLGKDILAQRMAQQWEAIRNDSDIPNGPLAISAVSDDNDSQVVVSFLKGTSEGLQVRQPNYFREVGYNQVSDASFAGLQGFEVAGSDGVFHQAAAVIEGDKVRVFSKEVKDIKQVRYLWSGPANPNGGVLLYNKLQLPASPFTLPVIEKTGIE